MLTYVFRLYSSVVHTPSPPTHTHTICSSLLTPNSYCPDVKTKGNGAAPNLVAFTSDESHYSYKKSCSLLGLGSDNLVAVQTNEKVGVC